MEKNININDTDFTLRQEVVNSIINAFGILFGIISIPVLTVLVAKNANVPGIVGASIYGFCFLMLFSFSTLYHGFQHPHVKRVLEILDHISIYFLIAGTYTPFLLIYLRNSFGIMLLSILWGLTILGVFFKIFFTGRFEVVSLIIYLLMGWILIVGGKRFFYSGTNECFDFHCNWWCFIQYWYYFLHVEEFYLAPCSMAFFCTGGCCLPLCSCFTGRVNIQLRSA